MNWGRHRPVRRPLRAFASDFGVFVGIAGLLLAIIAQKEAQLARQEAQRANQIARESNVLAAEANRISVDANQLAKDANLIASREEARVQERGDIRWDGDWPTPGSYELTNVGEDEAFNVKATVIIDGRKRQGFAETVRPGDGFIFDFKWDAKQFAKKRAESIARARFPDLLPPDDVVFRLFVKWETRLGQHRSYEIERGLTDLGIR